MQVSAKSIKRKLQGLSTSRFMIRACVSAVLAAMLVVPPVSARDGVRQVGALYPFYCGSGAAITIDTQPIYQKEGINGTDMVLVASSFGDSAGYVWGPYLQRRTIVGPFERIDLNFNGFVQGVDVTFCFYGTRTGALSFTIPLAKFRISGRTTDPMRHATLSRDQIAELHGDDAKGATLQRVTVNLDQFNKSLPSQTVVFGDVKVRIGDHWYEPVDIDSSTSARSNCGLRGCPQ